MLRTIRRMPAADWAALLLITVTALAFFAPVWARGGWLPYGGGDLVSFLWPTYTFAARTIPGDLPLWNPHLYGGAPYWADNQSGVLYPPNLLLFLLTDAPPYWPLELLVMLHIWGAGLAMYACLRLLRPDAPIKPAPAAVGAVAFMLSDVFVTHQGNLNLIAVAAWLPLVVLGTWRGLQSIGQIPRSGGLQPPRAIFMSPLQRIRTGTVGILNRWTVLAGIAFGVGTLAGHAQMTYFTGLAVGAVAISALVGVGRNWRTAGRMIGGLAVIGVITFGLSAAALLPTLEMTGYTARAGLTYEQAAQYSLPPQALIGLAAPGVYGRGPADFSGDWDRVEVGYMGALALGLAILGAGHGLRRRNRLVIGLVAWAVIALLLALGAYFPLHRLAYDLLPGMGSIRVPARFVLLFNLAGAMLAALGAQVFAGWMPARVRHRSGQQGENPPSRRPSTYGQSDRPPFPQNEGRAESHAEKAPSHLWGGDADRRSDGEGVKSAAYLRVNVLTWGLAIVVAVEVVAFGAGVEVQQADPTTGFAHTDAVDWLQSQPDAPFRIEGATPGWQPDSAALHGGPLYDIYGISNPLTLGSYEAFYWGVGQRGSPTYNFLGVKYVIATTDAPPGDASFVPVYEAESGVAVYLNTNARPLAHLVYRAEAVETPEAAWEAVHAPNWDPGVVVYVEDGPALDAQPPDGASLFFTVYEPNTLAVVVNTPEPAYLVLSEVWYPGWQATIDGQPTPIYRANTAFRAVYIDEPGEHTILLAFRPPVVIVGLAITIVTVLGLIVVGVRLLFWNKL
jgi:hypothetical protein